MAKAASVSLLGIGSRPWTLNPLTLSPDHFGADPVRLARELLGATLVRVTPDGHRLSGKVVETEAYDCPRDPACTAGRFHAARSIEMSIPPGHWLFWFAHGHPLLQVACREEGISASVLIRALEPLEGVPRMLDHRPVTRQRDLTSGPAKLVYALGLDPMKVSHLPVNSPELHLLAPEKPLADEEISVTARVGIKEGRHLPWRFLIRGNAWVSPGVPSMELDHA
ncbi:putative 3-methyladenine DNA glycosylase [Deinococcus wulumuqiensis]|uniref:Putative 3-methyladenine DNA glycosylase n=1 Tax=Deinococcus wulumuqiensis TaxID=980427 RepID=A0AAV4K4I4_9DEIO|nr:putative 3-methyladenine DNA glycosylase [Deinococcus wulumuqiensis]GGP29231.1 putative 3-methyladenine DNA glycosylase [Deinococcus wulumuqiensis]